MKCDKCNGTGIQKNEYKVTIPSPSGTNYIMGYSRTCLKCHGTGKLDWIENIVGKKQETTKSRVLSGFNYINKNI